CAPDRTALDLADLEALRNYLEQTRPAHIVHLAAETNVDLCEVKPEHATAVNLAPTRELADYCAKTGARMLYVSSSSVFAGNSKHQHSETDAPCPTNFYAMTKWRSEEWIAEHCPDYLIIRASWMVGTTSGPNKKFAEKMSGSIFNNVKEVKAVDDLFGSLTSGDRLADLIIHNLNKTSQAIIHCASKTICSRYEIANYIKAYFNSATMIHPVGSAEFPLTAARGLSEGLDSDLAQRDFGYQALSWEEELEHFLRIFKADNFRPMEKSPANSRLLLEA
ncbi:MAG: dTDP-4-dehydrorhamnose reductase, partial [Alphaproteobacteria bacterium]|nr:dTDP-4-dehydrorhamnose reductase [Alphaproteobacteria bacterium]